MSAQYSPVFATFRALLIFALVGTLCSAACPGGWVKHGLYCYKVNNDSNAASLDRQIASCRHQGGDLASIHNDDQQAFVEGLAESVAPTPVWIGLYDEHKNGTWEWSDGTPYDYQNWNDTQPDNVGDSEYCVNLLSSSENGTWADVECCNNSTVGICQMRDPELCQCPANWTYYPASDKCFKFFDVNESITQTNALSACKALGGSLAAIHDVFEQDVVYSLTQFATGGTLAATWIGLYRNTTGYYWTDETLVDFAYWATGEPNAPPPSFTVIHSVRGGNYANGRWNDASVGLAEAHSYVCQLPNQHHA